jgi:hypothetical protein
MVLAAFVSLLNEKTVGAPYDINAAGAWGDAESLIGALEQARYFQKMLNAPDPKIREACADVVLSDT